MRAHTAFPAPVAVPRVSRILTPRHLRHHVALRVRQPAAVAGWDGGDAVQLVSLTAASSAALLTALWARSRSGSPSAEEAAPGQEGAAAQQPGARPPPSSTAEVWAAAWAAFTPTQHMAADGNSSTGSVEGDTVAQPLLWLQGIKPAARAQLLALSLAALQAEVEALPSDVQTVLDGGQWMRICPAVLTACSIAAAAAWLGYTPASLQAAADTALTAAVPEAAGDGDSRSFGDQGPWYAVEERMPLYCSVLRLLKSSSIRTEQPGSSGSDGSNVRGGDSDSAQRAGSAAELATSGLEAQRQAQQLLLSHRSGNVASTALRGWRATQAGARSHSQLLDLAPSVLQDMAVAIADAVAGAYLAEVADGRAAPGASTAAAGGAAAISSEVLALAPLASAAAAGTGTAALVERSLEGTAPADAAQQSAPLELSLWPTFVHPRLASTRQLQRFANRLAMARWADRAFHSVAAMYEDRLPLFTLTQRTAGTAGGAARGIAEGPLLRVRRVPLKRATELSRLRGLRFAVSLVLEAADVAAPALRALWDRAAATLTWVLVEGLGRAAGLVWRGIKAGAAGKAWPAAAASRRRQGPPEDGASAGGTTGLPVAWSAAA